MTLKIGDFVEYTGQHTWSYYSRLVGAVGVVTGSQTIDVGEGQETFVEVDWWFLPPGAVRVESPWHRIQNICKLSVANKELTV